MPQLDFEMNYPTIAASRFTPNSGSITFCPMQIRDSISLNTVNLPLYSPSGAKTVTLRLGVYSITGSSLSLANSLSGSVDLVGDDKYLSLTATSSAQNMTPGTWFFGLLFSTSSNSNFTVNAMSHSRFNAENAFNFGFIGGAMTASTSALPSSIATSDLDVTGTDALAAPVMIISA